MSRKAEIVSKLLSGGLSKAEADLYFQTLTRFLLSKMTKLEFETSISRLLSSKDKYRLHNEVILGILHRAQQNRDGLPELPRLIPMKDARRVGLTGKNNRGKRAMKESGMRVAGKRKRNEEVPGTSITAFMETIGEVPGGRGADGKQQSKRVKKGILRDLSALEEPDTNQTALFHEESHISASSFSRKRKYNVPDRLRKVARASRSKNVHSGTSTSFSFSDPATSANALSGARQLRSSLLNSKDGFPIDSVIEEQYQGQHLEGREGQKQQQYLRRLHARDEMHESVIARRGSTSAAVAVMKPHVTAYQNFLKHPFHPTDMPLTPDMNLFHKLKGRLIKAGKEYGITEFRDEAVLLLVDAVEDRVRNLLETGLKHFEMRSRWRGATLDRDSFKRALGVVQGVALKGWIRKDQRLVGRAPIAMERLLLG